MAEDYSWIDSPMEKKEPKPKTTKRQAKQKVQPSKISYLKYKKSKVSAGEPYVGWREYVAGER